jgi:UDP-N-acetylglucosamine 2-epimerase (non-hydrolysing)
MPKIVSIIGTRPEAIKMAPVIRAFAAHPDCDSVVVSTSQHADLLRPVLDLFGIEADYDLAVMKPGQTPTDVAAAILSRLPAVLREIDADWVLVQGDTTTVMAGALAAFHERIKVGHVEAGLRTWDFDNPFPEEMNRQVVSRIASLHFAPTEQAAANLRAENIDSAIVKVTGNTVIDALQWVRGNKLDSADSTAVPGPDGKVALLTAHRRENHGAGIAGICEAVRQLCNRFPDLTIVYPVHPNPNVHDVVHRRLSDVDNVRLLKPVDYATVVALLDRADIVLTDSGGIQEEAPGLGKPVLVLRETTERPEAVDAGTVKLVGTNTDAIVSEASHLLTDPDAYSAMSHAVNPYGDGRAAARIVEAVVSD